MRVWMVLGLLFPASAMAQQAAVAHQGRLLDGAGVPLDGTYSLTLSVMDDADAGASLLSRTESVEVSDGYFSVILAGVDAELLSGARWLAVQVGTVEMRPRQPLGAVAEALHASGARLTDVDVVCDAASTEWHGTLRFRNDVYEGCTSDGWTRLSL